MHNSGASRRGMAGAYPQNHCHRLRKRAIQHSETPVIESISRGVLDTPLSRSMTGRCGLSRVGYRHLLRAAYQLDTRLRGFHQAAIGGEVIERHAARGETRLELLADGIAAEIGQPAD